MLTLYNLQQSVSLTEEYCGLCEVRVESLHITEIHLNLSYLGSSWH